MSLARKAFGASADLTLPAPTLSRQPAWSGYARSIALSGRLHSLQAKTFFVSGLAFSSLSALF